MKDAEQRTREELQTLLEENPNLEPMPMQDNGQVVTLTIVDGIPAITQVEIPTAYSYDLPDISDIRGTSIYRIYQLLKSLKVLDGEPSVEVATVQAQLPTQPDAGVANETATEPTIPEIVHSTACGTVDIKTQEDRFGMYRNLERLQKQMQAILAANPELTPLVIKTATANIQIAVVGGSLELAPSTKKGKPYAQVSNGTHAQLLRLSRTIEGLEKKLYGSVVSITVAKAPVKVSAADNLASQLEELECGNLAVFIRSRKKILYISGTEKSISYRGTKTYLSGSEVKDKEASKDPVGYPSVEYGALPKSVASLLQAYWAYISPKSAKQD